MIPAPGLIALVLVPVSQLSVAENPMASWQDPELLATCVSGPIVTFRSPELLAQAEKTPTATLLHPDVMQSV
jgi:hypothetical protein